MLMLIKELIYKEFLYNKNSLLYNKTKDTIIHVYEDTLIRYRGMIYAIDPI